MSEIFTRAHERRLMLAITGALVSLTCTTGAYAAAARHRPDHHSPARHSRARRAIVGGTQISITQAPWQVLVEAMAPPSIYRCGGSIINETEILTAAHCIYNTESKQIPAGDFTVVDGTSDYETTPPEQEVAVESIRIHPYFEYNPGLHRSSPDDVAVLKLSTPLSLAGPAARSIGLVTSGFSPPQGTAVNLTGFGLQQPESKADGQLYSLGMTIGSSEQCGGEADALLLCASTPAGSGCFGDSGSAMTSTESTPILLGVEDAIAVVSSKDCAAGASNTFANVGAHEIKDFIEGNPAPPKAPRGGNDIVIRAVPEVGHVVTCEPGTWSNTPTFSYGFIDSTGGQVLQTGQSPTYQLVPTDVGRTIYCLVAASNAGGTGTVKTASLRPVRPGSTPPVTSPQPTPHESSADSQSAGASVSIANAHITVQSNGVALVRLRCKAAHGCHGKITLMAKAASRGKKKSLHMITIAAASFSIAPEATETVKVRLAGSGLALLSSDHGRLNSRLTILQSVPTPTRTQTENVHLVEQKLVRRSSKKSKT
jgi:trypsin